MFVLIKKINTMQKIFFIAFFMLVGWGVNAQNSPVGTWKTIDDETDKAKSYVEIYEQDGELYGKVVKILDPSRANMKCTECKGDKKDKKILGLVILEGLEKDGKKWDDGEIIDPKTGKTYDCSIELISKDKLKVRGYLGISLLGRTQYWYRIK